MSTERGLDAQTPTRQRPRRALRWLGALCALAWAAAVGAGLERIWRYEGTPGAARATPTTWPGSQLVTPRPGMPTLLMFVHPRCSCTRASLAELGEVMAREGDRVAAWVVLLHPAGARDEWSRTETRAAAQRIPNLTVVTDTDGAEAARFGALTSGHVTLFDADGRLLFAGGITGARGHAGDNDGRRRVLELVAGAAHEGAPEHADAHAVYGCSIHDEESAPPAPESSGTGTTPEREQPSRRRPS